MWQLPSIIARRKSAVNYLGDSFHSMKNLRPLLGIVRTLAADTEPEVRQELMGILTKVVDCCLSSEPELIGQHVVPIIKRTLIDSECLVQAKSHEVFKNLLYKHAIKEEIIRTEFFPLIIDQIQEGRNENNKIILILTIGKIAEIVGRERIKEDFLNLWIELSSHPDVLHREACAAIVSDLGCVLGEELTETFVLPTFIKLCHDENQGVRKCCAEKIAALAHVVSVNARYLKLTPLFASFLEDESKWVQMVAYSVIGQFAYAFYFPSYGYVESYLQQKIVNCIHSTKFEKLNIHENPKEENTLQSCKNMSDTTDTKSSNNVIIQPQYSIGKFISSNRYKRMKRRGEINSKHKDDANSEWAWEHESSNLHMPSSSRENPLSNLDDSFTEFNHFIYWQYPFPDIQIEMDLLNSNTFKIIKRRPFQEASQIRNEDQVVGDVITNSPEKELVTIKETGDFIHSQPLPKNDLSNDHKLPILKNEPSGGDEITPFISDIDMESNNRLDSFITRVKWRLPTEENLDDEFPVGDQIELGYKDLRKEYEKCSLSKTISEYKSNALLQLSSLGASECLSPPSFLLNHNQPRSSFANESHNPCISLPFQQCAKDESHQAQLIAQTDPRSFGISCDKCPRDGVCTLEQYLASTLWPEYSKHKIYVPREILQHFLNMMNPDILERFDIPSANFAHMCAFALPAITITLGAKNWEVLRSLFDKLVRSERSRETVAASLHDLASVLGPQIAASDLVPIFLEFIDFGEEHLRSTLARNLCSFLKCLDRRDQYSILQNLKTLFCAEQMVTSQWRFRHELVLQLLTFLKETKSDWKPFELNTYFIPIIHATMGDRSHAIREISICLAHTVYQGLTDDISLRHEFLRSLRDFLTHDADHKKYKLYIYLCNELLGLEGAISFEDVDILVPSLLQLSDNHVSTVRLVLARCLNEIKITGPLNEKIQETLAKLQLDDDNDVRYYATPVDKR